MAQLADIWRFTRDRLRQSFDGLSDEQMAWRCPNGGHTVFEYLFHVAGAEHYWASRLTGRDPAATELEAKLDRAVIDNFLEEGGCPFGEDEMNRAAVEGALKFAFESLDPVIDNPSDEQLAAPMKGPAGDTITGREGLIRVAQHAAYHTGQIWMVRFDGSFPQE